MQETQKKLSAAGEDQIPGTLCIELRLLAFIRVDSRFKTGIPHASPQLDLSSGRSFALVPWDPILERFQRHFGTPVEQGNRGKNTKSGKMSSGSPTRGSSVYNRQRLQALIVARRSARANASSVIVPQ